MTSDFPRLSQLARDASESLARAQQPALEALDRLAEIAWQALDPRSAPQGHPVGVDEWVVASTYSIYSAACGRVSAVGLLTRSGLLGPACALTRGLFENLLTMEFILRPEFKRKTGRALASEPERGFDRATRARMYAVHSLLQERRQLRNIEKDCPVLWQDMGGPATAQVLLDGIQARVDRFGLPQDVQDEVMSSPTAAGLDVWALAVSLGPIERPAPETYVDLYRMEYAHMSGEVHGGSLLSAMDATPEGLHVSPFRTDEQRVRHVVLNAASYVLMLMATIQRDGGYRVTPQRQAGAQCLSHMRQHLGMPGNHRNPGS